MKDYQLLLKYVLQANEDGSYKKNEDGKVVFKIVDGTQKVNERKVFEEDFVDFNENEEIMIQEMFDKYCDWYALNKNIVRKYFESKKF